VEVDGIGPMPAVFIRAPVLTDVWGDTQVLSEFKGRCVVAARDLVLAAAFHPELTPDTRLHERFLEMVAEATRRDSDVIP
jgi:pyridoxal 5'-phosphate synthase pdxT subunit